MVPFGPPTSKTPSRTKHGVNQTICRGDIAISPPYLAGDCRLVADAREWRLRSTASRTWVVTRTYSTFSDRAFGAAGPGLWNSLPSHLKDADISYSEFRRSLNTFLFGQWGHGAVWTVLIAPTRNILTYLLTYLLFQFFNMAAKPPSCMPSRHLAFCQTRNSSIWSADLKNITVEPNMKWIGWRRPLAEIWPFEIFPYKRSVGRRSVLNIYFFLHWFHILLFATLGT